MRKNHYRATSLRRAALLTLVFLFSFLFMTETGARNRAYEIVRQEAKIYSNPRETGDEISNAKELLVIHKGDTVEAPVETQAFLEDRAEKGFHMLPVRYKGVRGYVYIENLRPVKTSETDTITMIQDKPLEKMAALERSLIKYQNGAMNLPVEPMTWMWIAIGSVLFSALIMGLRMFRPQYVKDCLPFMFVGMAAASASEIIYLLAMGEHALGFFNPNYVGWGLAILNFILMGVFLCIQYALYYLSWRILLESDSKGGSIESPEWMRMLVFYPAVLALVTVIMVLVDAFTGNTWDLKVYIWVYASLLLPALASAVGLLIAGKLLRALAAPIYYIAGAAGLTVCLSILGLWILVLGVVIVVVAIVGGAVIGTVFSMLSGVGRVSFTTPDGRRMSGMRDVFGNVIGDDGKNYII